MGTADLRKMQQGIMDPQGKGITQSGWICGITGTILCSLIGLTCGGFVLIGILNDR
jgi:hypothetical protein